MQILGHIGSDRRRVIPKYMKYNTFVTFLTVLIFLSILSTGQTAAQTHTLTGSYDVFQRKEVPFRG